MEVLKQDNHFVIRIKHFWIAFRNEDDAEKIIDDLEKLCIKHAIKDQYYFKFE